MPGVRLVIIVSLIVEVVCKMKPFVVGGENADILEFPHVASLRILCKSNKGHIVGSPYMCGSSIVSQQILLTAAHCLYNFPCIPTVTVSVGSERRKTKGTFQADEYIIHEDYNEQSLNNDIALVRLANRINLGPKVKRVALMEHPPYNGQALLAGWGVINEATNDIPKYLQYTKQYVMEKNNCHKILKSLPKGTFCARNMDSTRYASSGDSGGPLVVRGYIQIGIVSTKISSLSNSITIYTDIGHHYKWINKNWIKIMCEY